MVSLKMVRIFTFCILCFSVFGCKSDDSAPTRQTIYEYVSPRIAVHDSLTGAYIYPCVVEAIDYDKSQIATFGETFFILSFKSDQGKSIMVDFKASHTSYISNTKTAECLPGRDPEKRIINIWMLPK